MKIETTAMLRPGEAAAEVTRDLVDCPVRLAQEGRGLTHRPVWRGLSCLRHVGGQAPET